MIDNPPNKQPSPPLPRQLVVDPYLPLGTPMMSLVVSTVGAEVVPARTTMESATATGGAPWVGVTAATNHPTSQPAIPAGEQRQPMLLAE